MKKNEIPNLSGVYELVDNIISRNIRHIYNLKFCKQNYLLVLLDFYSLPGV